MCATLTIRYCIIFAMSHINHLNIFKGEDSLIKFFDPEEAPLLPLVELPSRLNPYHGDKVRIYCKLMTALPAQNVKALPGWSRSRCEQVFSRSRLQAL